MADFEDPLARAEWSTGPQEPQSNETPSLFSPLAQQPYDTYGPSVSNGSVAPRYPAVIPPTPALTTTAHTQRIRNQTSGVREMLATAPPLMGMSTITSEDGVNDREAESPDPDRGQSAGDSGALAARHGVASRPSDLHIEVGDPQVKQPLVPLPGVHSKYVEYAVTTQTTRSSFAGSVMTVRRRFSDFVALDSLLRITHRGYFITPRPDKHVASTGKLKAAFIERRRAALQAYLQRLAGHSVIGASAELRVFLETSESLQSSMAWASLQPAAPGWLSGAARLFNQVIGRERLAPAPAAAARPARESHDFARQVREKIYQMRHKGVAATALPPREAALRVRSDLVRELASSVSMTAYHGTRMHRALFRRVRELGELGLAVSQLGHTEQTHMALEIGRGSKRLGDACLQGNTAGQTALARLGRHVWALEEQAHAMTGVLDALHGREEALLTLLTLSCDVAAKRSRAAELQAQNHTAQVQRVLQEAAALEAARLAAQAEYDRVASRNEQELERFVQNQSHAVVQAMTAWAAAQHIFAEEEACVWMAAANDLGADTDALQVHCGH